MPKKSYQPGDFRLAVRRARAGLGLFAVDLVPKGACIIEYTGKLLTRQEYLASNSRYLFDVGPSRTLDGSARSNRARYINHSCVPNCEPDINKYRVFIRALRDIEPGEELAYDYGVEYFEEYIGRNCRCPQCMPDMPVKAVKAAKPKPAPRPSRKVEPVLPDVATPEPRRKAA